MNIFDGEFSSVTRVDMYRAQITPELYPDERPMMLGNWDPEDLAAFCGGKYTT